MSTIIANMQLEKKNSSYTTGAAVPKPMIPWLYEKPLEMRPVLVSKTIGNEASTSQYYQYIIGSCWS